MTIWPAWQHFEESDKGTIEPGKIADFVISSDDPTAVDPETLADIEVRVTIKDGKVIYEAGNDSIAQNRGRLMWPSVADPASSHALVDTLYRGFTMAGRARH